jgi:nucleoside-diphosphate-sugar epimerase
MNVIVGPKILVTGASGFLGNKIIEELLDPSSPIKPSIVLGFDIKAYSAKVPNHFKFIQGDIRNYSEVVEALKGVDVVIHSAAIIDWGTKTEKDVMDCNLGGTQNIIKACKENGVRNLVYTSSLDAVFTGKALVNINESQAYPKKHANVYCASKHLSEVEVVQANSEKLKTCVLRPGDFFGEKDPYHIDPLINMAKSGFYVRLGNGKSKCQHVYVRNMAYAHVLAANALWNNNKKVEGEIYFITDGLGDNFFTFFDKIVIGSGYTIFPKNFWIPKSIAYAMGAMSEWTAILVRPIKKYNPNFSRFAVTYTCTDFTFSAQKAERDFSFKPKYTASEAFAKTVAFYKKNEVD